MTEKELREKVVKAAEKYRGSKESNGSHKPIIDTYNKHKPLARGYEVQYTDAWCATFVSTVAIDCGLTDIMPTECSCTKMIELHKKLGQWKEEDGYSPKIGDILMYDWEDSGSGENKGTPNHVGIVISEPKSGSYKVLEGNYGNAVKERKMSVNGKYIRGYCLPNYASKAEKEVAAVPDATPLPKPSAVKPTRTPIYVTAMAKECIKGVYGNGATRKKKLYETVQKEVNRLCGIVEGTKPAKHITDFAKAVIAGNYGNGVLRKEKIYRAVQNEVNKILKG